MLRSLVLAGLLTLTPACASVTYHPDTGACEATARGQATAVCRDSETGNVVGEADGGRGSQAFYSFLGGLAGVLVSLAL